MAKRFLAPEILQISTMDCGVAALCCMLSAYGVRASYDRLREACQTSVDGTSVDALEDLCVELGVDVIQHVVPVDMLWEVARMRLPALTIVALPNMAGLHFVCLWRRLGSRVQVMDPRGGRRWPKLDSFKAELYVHSLVLGEADWRDWFSTSAFRDALVARGRELLSPALYEQTVAQVLATTEPRAVSAVDAALRLVAMTLDASGPKPRSFCDKLFERAWATARGSGLPASFVAVHLEDDAVRTEGVILMAPPEAGDAVTEGAATVQGRADSRGLTAGAETSVWSVVRVLLGREGRLLGGALAVGIAVLALATTVEMLLYRAALDAPRLFATVGLRVGAATAIGALFALILGLEACVVFGGERLARHLELVLRVRTLWALPRVNDNFVRSRPTSDLAYRAQSLSFAGLVVGSMANAARASCDLLVTFVAIALLDARFILVVAVGAAGFVLAWLGFRSRLHDIDARLQTHASRLLNVILDSLRGIRPVRLHGFQDALRTRQLDELDEWVRASEGNVHMSASLRAAYGAAGTLLLVTLFAAFLARGHDARGFVLLALWSFRIPTSITLLAQFAESYPRQRNALTRLVEILGVELPEDVVPGEAPAGPAPVSFRNVDVVAGGTPVLHDVSLDIPAGQHVAVVGASGSGKSTLVSLLLGFHQVTRGTILLDGRPFDADAARALRPQIAWIDPSVQLWNTTLGANLEYAVRSAGRRPTTEVLEEADLIEVLGSLEQGLSTPIGAEGAFLSGGEGERLRVGRALFRAGIRVAVLDEAFRGLERAVRNRLAVRARQALRRSTMLFVSHDVSQALGFERVLVVEDGRIVEDGVPADLAQRPSRFAEMLVAERELLDRAWTLGRWRGLDVVNGTIVEARDGR